MFKKILSVVLLATTVLAGEPLPGDMSSGEMIAVLAPRTNGEAFAQGLPPLRPRDGSKYLTTP